MQEELLQFKHKSMGVMYLPEGNEHRSWLHCLSDGCQSAFLDETQKEVMSNSLQVVKILLIKQAYRVVMARYGLHQAQDIDLNAKGIQDEFHGELTFFLGLQSTSNVQDFKSLQSVSSTCGQKNPFGISTSTYVGCVAYKSLRCSWNLFGIGHAGDNHERRSTSEEVKILAEDSSHNQSQLSFNIEWNARTYSNVLLFYVILVPALAAEEEQVLVLILGLQVLCKGCQGTPTQSAAHFKVLSPSTSASFEAVFKPLRPIQVWNAEEQQTAAEVSCSISNKRLSISVPHNATSKAPTQAVETTKNEEVARKIQAYGMLRRKKEIESRRNLHDYRAPSYMIHLMEMYLLSHRANITSAFDTLRDTHYWRRLNQVMMKFWKDQEEWEIIRRGFHESSDSNTRIEYGTNSHVLLKRRYPHIKRVE
ncbi:hypothetical protein Tco_0475437 [Tanacetum coccineum]